MWHEQRREEKRIKGMLVDRRKRAERRRDYWERIKSDPVQFLQVHGRSVKIHLDPAIAAAGDNPVNMMPWPGDEKIIIDRFDGRANLDHIPEYNSKTDKQELSSEEAKELRVTNYERYKILIQNEFLNVTEDKFLHTIELEEKYGSSTYQGKKAKEDKKLTGSNKVAIGFRYEDSAEPSKQEPDEDDESDLDSDEDFDLNLDITSLTGDQVIDMNKLGNHYGLEKKDVCKFFTKDFEDQEQIKAQRAKEAEKSGDKKSRRRRNRIRIIEGDPLKPAYALKREASGSKSRSRSASSSSSESESGDGAEEKIEFITTFGGDSDQDKLLDSSAEKSDKKIGPKLPKHKKKKKRRSRSRSRKSSRRRSRSRSPDDWVRRRHSRRSRSRSGSRPGRRSSRSISQERRTIERRLRRAEDSPPPPRKAYSPPPKPKEAILSDSDSSDSDEGGNNGSRYRSKYRNRKADSSDESEEDAGTKSPEPEKPSMKEGTDTDSLYHNSLSRFFKGIQDNKEDKKKEEPTPVLNPMLTAPEPPPIKRYYGRNKGNNSDSELSLDSDGSEEEQTQRNIVHRNGKNGSKGPTAMKEESVSIKDKLKKKMLQQIKKTFKEDKKAEKERLRKMEEEEQLREEELRDLSEKMRLRERERRRAEGRDSDSESRSRSSSPRSRRRSRSRSSDRRRERRRSRSRRRRKSRTRSKSRSRDRSIKKRDRSKSRSRSTYISRKGERKRKSRSKSREAKKSRNGSTEEMKKLVDY